MKLRFIRYLIIFCYTYIIIDNKLFSQPIIAKLQKDTVKILVQYNVYNGYINDSAYTRAMPCFVYLGKTGSISVIEIQKIEDWLKEKSETSSSDPNIRKMVEEQMKSSEALKKSLITVMIRKYNDPAYYTYKHADDQNVLLQDTSVFHWTLTNEFKTINTFRCQKATARQGNSLVNAWFTEQIPIPSGPGFINGLPGLILEYFNPQNSVCYKVREISSDNIISNKFKELPVSTLVKKSEYDILVQKDQQKIKNIQKMIESGKVQQNN